MILAAGRGTRLGALGERVAKALVEIDGRSLLAHHLDFLAPQGVEMVVVNASHLAQQLIEFAAERSGPPELRVVLEDEPLGTAGGVIHALPQFSTEPLLVYYGDVIAREGLGTPSEPARRSRGPSPLWLCTTAIVPWPRASSTSKVLGSSHSTKRIPRTPRAG